MIQLQYSVLALSLILGLNSLAVAGPRIFKVNNSTSVTIEDSPLSEEELNKLNGQLTAADMAEFQKRRTTFLTVAAKVLGKTLWYEGAKKVIGNRARIFLKGEAPISIINPDSELVDEYENPYNSNFTRLSVKGIQEQLDVVNHEFWIHAPIVVHANEYGVMLLVSVNGGATIGHQGIYNSLGTGLAIGVNTRTKAAYVEALGDFEHLDSGIPGQVQLAVTAKVSLYVADKNNDIVPYDHARASYPMGPFGLEDSANHFAFSWPVSFGLVSSPFDSFMGVKNHLKRKLFFRKKLANIPIENDSNPDSDCRGPMSF